MIDSHCHLDLEVFASDREQVMAQARDVGVTRFHIPGTTPHGWAIQRELAALFGDVDLSFGLHPYFLNADWREHLNDLQQLLESNDRPVALGEIGLDGDIDIPFEQQWPCFIAQLSLARELQLPVIMHHRKSHHLLLKGIKQARFEYGGIVHAFSGSLDVAKRYIDNGFALGIGGTITYERARKTTKTVQSLPLEHFVLETDSPDMPINGYQGKRNEPKRLVEVCSALAKIKSCSLEEVGKVTSQTYFDHIRCNRLAPRHT